MKQELEALKCGDSNPKKAQKRISRVLTVSYVLLTHGYIQNNIVFPGPNKYSSWITGKKTKAK